MLLREFAELLQQFGERLFVGVQLQLWAHDRPLGQLRNQLESPLQLEEH